MNKVRIYIFDLKLIIYTKVSKKYCRRAIIKNTIIMFSSVILE